MVRALIVTLAIVAVLLPQRDAGADEKQAEQIEQFSRMLATLESEDDARSATAELNVLRNKLLEARLLLRDDKPKDLARLLKLLKPQVQLIRAQIDQGLAEKRAAVQRSKADELDEKVTRLRREKDQLEQRLTVLESQAQSRAATPRPGGEVGTVPAASPASPATTPAAEQ